MSSVDRPGAGARPGALWAVLSTLVAGGATFLVVTLFDLDTASALTLSILVGGIVLLIRFLADFESRLASVERLERDGQADMRRLVGDAFTEVSEATALFGLIEASALRTDLVTQLVRNSTAVSPDSPPIVYQFVHPGPLQVAETRLVLTEGRVREMSQLFRELWEVAGLARLPTADGDRTAARLDLLAREDHGVERPASAPERHAGD